jgi:hypothetical protein
MAWAKTHRWQLVALAIVLLVFVLHLIAVGAFGSGTGGVTTETGPIGP